MLNKYIQRERESESALLQMGTWTAKEVLRGLGSLNL